TGSADPDQRLRHAGHSFIFEHAVRDLYDSIGDVRLVAAVEDRLDAKASTADPADQAEAVIRLDASYHSRSGHHAPPRRMSISSTMGFGIAARRRSCFSHSRANTRSSAARLTSSLLASGRSTTRSASVLSASNGQPLIVSGGRFATAKRAIRRQVRTALLSAVRSRPLPFLRRSWTICSRSEATSCSAFSFA